MFKTETHMHTSEVSGCGHLTAEEMVEYYHEAGYSTLFVSDHYTPYFFKKKADLSFEEAVDAFFEGYRNAVQAAEKYGMTVLPSAELAFENDPNHYLVYGIDTDFFKTYPNMLFEGAVKFHDIARANGLLLIQAHPFRDACRPNPEAVDGFEIYNSNPRHFLPEDEPQCVEICEKHGLFMTAGSDSHRPEDVAGAGVQTPEKITSAADYIRALQSGNFERIYNGQERR